jgi:hypothetical protein
MIDYAADRAAAGLDRWANFQELLHRLHTSDVVTAGKYLETSGDEMYVGALSEKTFINKGDFRGMEWIRTCPRRPDGGGFRHVAGFEPTRALQLWPLHQAEDGTNSIGKDELWPHKLFCFSLLPLKNVHEGGMLVVRGYTVFATITGVVRGKPRALNGIAIFRLLRAPIHFDITPDEEERMQKDCMTQEWYPRKVAKALDVEQKLTVDPRGMDPLPRKEPSDAVVVPYSELFPNG